MADNYLEFSETLEDLETEEEVWLHKQLEIVCVHGDREYAGEQPPDEWRPIEGVKPQKKGFDLLKEALAAGQFSVTLEYTVPLKRESTGDLERLCRYVRGSLAYRR